MLRTKIPVCLNQSHQVLPLSFFTYFLFISKHPVTVPISCVSTNHFLILLMSIYCLCWWFPSFYQTIVSCQHVRICNFKFFYIYMLSWWWLHGDNKIKFNFMETNFILIPCYSQKRLDQEDTLLGFPVIFLGCEMSMG